ncbi:hypothetical protein [Nonomuraea sp. NPDC001831]|uniref:hypothetical protein n=1 Tax=Nonomuraea sp. NPDC001831 TaxID=3364340 RepID=UPI0036C818DA
MTEYRLPSMVLTRPARPLTSAGRGDRADGRAAEGRGLPGHLRRAADDLHAAGEPAATGAQHHVRIEDGQQRVILPTRRTGER